MITCLDLFEKSAPCLDPCYVDPVGTSNNCRRHLYMLHARVKRNFIFRVSLVCPYWMALLKTILITSFFIETTFKIYVASTYLYMLKLSHYVQ